MVSSPIATVASIRVLAGSTIVTPARWCASWMRRWASRVTRARSTRSLTPSARSGSGSGYAWTDLPSASSSGSTSGRYSSPWALSSPRLAQGGQERAAVEHVQADVDLADRELVLRSRRRRPWSRRRARSRRRPRGSRARSRPGRRARPMPASRRPAPPSWAARTAAIASPVTSGMSPLITSTGAAGSIMAVAAATASPVPRGCSWIATSTSVGEMLGEQPLRVVDDDHAPGARRARGEQRPEDHRAPADRVQDLGKR